MWSVDVQLHEKLPNCFPNGCTVLHSHQFLLLSFKNKVKKVAEQGKRERKVRRRGVGGHSSPRDSTALHLQDSFSVVIFVEMIFVPLLGLPFGPLSVTAASMDEFYTLGM